MTDRRTAKRPRKTGAFHAATTWGLDNPAEQIKRDQHQDDDDEDGDDGLDNPAEQIKRDQHQDDDDEDGDDGHSAPSLLLSVWVSAPSVRPVRSTHAAPLSTPLWPTY